MSVIRSFFKALAIAMVSAVAMFFLGVFITLIVLLIIASLNSSHPDMTISYRIVGLTAGCTGFVLGFVGSLAYDARRLARTTSR